MDQLLERIAVSWLKNPEARIHDTERAELELGRSFPSDYRQFLLWSNGGEGYIGSTYFSFWEVGRLKELNVSYRIDYYLPNILGIGTDSGGECYALDFRDDPSTPLLVQVPLGDLDEESVVFLAHSLKLVITQNFRV